jgi:predicted dehydrogenase
MPRKQNESGTNTRKADVSRRTFLNTAALGAGALAFASQVRAAKDFGERVLGSNERLVMGIIGSGGMGRHHMHRFKAAGVEWGGVADVYSENLKAGMEIAGPNAKAYKDYRALLDNKDIQAVLIASPEHWHHKHLLDALAAGKDAYCEKPMCWSIQQGAEMVKAVRSSDRIVQIGMQRRSSPVIHEIKKNVFDAGVLGNIHIVRAEWYWNSGVNPNVEVKGDLDWEGFCGPAGKQEYHPTKFRYWRYFWPFSGGNETDQGTHLMDVVQWMMGVDQPLSAVQSGSVYRNKPTETPDTFCCTFEYPNFLCTWTLCYTTSSWRNGWSICFQGDKASLFLTEQGYAIFPAASGEDNREWTTDLGKVADKKIVGGVTDTIPHTKNFIECVKSRKQPNAPVEIGHTAVRPLHLANAALKAGRKAVLDKDGVTIRLDA